VLGLQFFEILLATRKICCPATDIIGGWKARLDYGRP